MNGIKALQILLLLNLMIKRNIWILYIIILMVLSGCNNDIFLDEPLMPDDLSATIEGDGGEVTFTIPTKGLEHISFDTIGDEIRYCTYYNHSGSIIDVKSPASEVAKIVYETDFNKREIIHNGTQLTVRSICSTDNYERTIGVRLDYSYTIQTVKICILPGKPLILENVEYHGEPVLTESTLVKTSAVQINNQSESDKVWEEYPYVNALGEILVEPDRYSRWLLGEPLPINVPVYDNGQWIWEVKEGLKGDIKYTIRRPDYLHKVEVIIPANTVLRVFSDVTYVQAKASGTITFLNEILNCHITVDINVTSIYPVNYEIRIEEVK